jgi:hypothetical protein
MAGTDFLSGEPVEGELLADRLAKGSLSLGEVLGYAIEIGGILQTVHARGRVHGSVSPGSIVLTKSGARVLRPVERIRGEPSDERTDILAFGVLLRRMAHGSETPATLECVIASLTAEDPARRRQRLQTAATELRLISSSLTRATWVRHRQLRRTAKAKAAQAMPRKVPARLRGGLVGIAVTALFTLAASAIAAAVLLEHKPDSRAFKFTVAPPEHTSYAGAPAVSPDGRYLAFSAVGTDGGRMLWLRSLDALHALMILGTEGGSDPFWSPDSQSIGFFANHSLRRVRVTGELPQTICAADGLRGGGAWNSDGTIVFAPGMANGLYRVPADGGTPEPFLHPDSAKGERSLLWPKFLPDGKRLVFFELTERPETTGVYTAVLGSGERRMLFRSEANAVLAAAAAPARSRHVYLLFLKEGSLTGQAFSASRLNLEGEPVTLADDIDMVKSLSLMPVSASNNGVLAYQSATRMGPAPSPESSPITIVTNWIEKQKN